MDVADLREFYDSPLGAAARRQISARLTPRLDGAAGGVSLGLGFATPYLDLLGERAQALLAFMPARQGVLHWPAHGASAAALVDEADLPLLDGVVDLMIVIHGLELADNPSDLLREIWRVLSPQGRVLFVVPNRRGMWARFDSTPFGHGRPYSRPQLSHLLKEAQFSAVGWTHALFMPPFERGLSLNFEAAWERFGTKLSPAFSGVIIAEAVKQVYAVSSAKRARRFMPRLNPVLRPALSGPAT